MLRKLACNAILSLFLTFLLIKRKMFKCTSLANQIFSYMGYPLSSLHDGWAECQNCIFYKKKEFL
jgi:hypothetical protein